MKIEERHFKQWFPKDNRFLHFCAKYYGMSFHNDEVVEEASFQALKNVMRVYKREQEFGDEPEMMGMVMSCFRFGILNAYDTHKRRNRLPYNNESELTYGEGKEEYSKFLNSAVSHDKEYDNLTNLLHQFIDANLTRVEKIVVKENILGESTYKMMSNEHELTVNVLRAARERAIRKLKRYVKQITNTQHTKDKQADGQEYVSSARSKLRIEILLESARAEQAERDRYSKALSYVYLDE